MSSNNTNTHPDYDPNIRIKAEPNTESATPTINPALSNLNAVIKTEPGLPTPSSTVRLPSFRPPRDYSLGGNNAFANIKLEKPKKVFAPNVNVQRNKNREDSNDSGKKHESGKTGRGFDRDKRRNDKSKERGKGRGKAANNLVQSSGIFSEGLADMPSKRPSSGIFRDRDGSGSSRETAAMMERPKLSIPQKVNKVEEEEKLRDLRRDDFIDDDLDVDMENTPVSLPMIHESKLFKTNSSQKVNLAKENDEIPISLQNGNAASHSTIKPAVPDTKVKEAKLPLTVPQIMENRANNFILIQLPDCLPGLQSDDSDPRSKPGPENETDKSNKFCTLNSLKEGMLGKLQILRSGKARLLLGTNNLIVDVGSNISFRQDLIAADINNDKHNGELVHLGAVNSTLICSPDWENMLKAL